MGTKNVKLPVPIYLDTDDVASVPDEGCWSVVVAMDDFNGRVQ